MSLSSNSIKKTEPKINKPSKTKSSKKKSIETILDYAEKNQICISKFQIKSSLKKNKSKEQKTKINIIINNNNPINYSSSPINNININLLNEEKTIKDCDKSSTFIFTGDNISNLDNNLIIDNYLRGPPIKPIFDSKSISSISNKEENELLPLQENSFTLSSLKSSLPSNTMVTNPNRKNNKKLMSLLKKANIKNNSEGIREKKDKIKCSNKNYLDTMEKKEKKLKKKVRSKRRTNKIYLIIFVFINICAYIYFIVRMFEPSVTNLFYDNDHDDYIYKTSILSQDRSITMNK